MDSSNGGGINALEMNDTWKIVDLPEGKKAIDSKWVYKMKFDEDGNVTRLKARLVARGDKQVAGKDYNVTFSPVAKFASVRILIALATSKKWKLHQLDINNAFLHGYLDKEIYLRIPDGFGSIGEGKVFKLIKSIYGLRQSSR